MDQDVLNGEDDFPLPNQVIKTMKCEHDWDCTFGLYCNGEFCHCPSECEYIEAFESCDCGEVIPETAYLPIIVGVVCGFFIVAGWSLVIGVLITSHVKKKRKHLKDHENQLDFSRQHNTVNPQVTLMTTIDTASPSGELNGLQNHTSNDKQQNNLTKSSSFNRHTQHCPHRRSLRSQSRSPTPHRFNKSLKSHSRSPTPQRNNSNKSHSRSPIPQRNNSNKSHSHSPTPQRNNSQHKSNSRSPTPNRTIGQQDTCQKYLSPFAFGSTEPQPSIHRRHSLNPKITTQNSNQFKLTPRRHSLHPSITNIQKDCTDSVSQIQPSGRNMTNHTSRHKIRKNSLHKTKRPQNTVAQPLQENIPENHQLPLIEHIYEEMPGESLNDTPLPYNLPGESNNCTPLPYNLHPVIEIPVSPAQNLSNVNNIVLPSAPIIQLNSQGLHNPPPYNLHPVIEIPVSLAQTSSSHVNNIVLPSAPIIQLNSQGLHNPPYPVNSSFSPVPLPPNTPPPPYYDDL